MGTLTGRITSVLEILSGDQFTMVGRTVTFLPMTMKVTGADRHNGQTFVLSANLSAQSIPLSPLGVSAPAMLIYFMSDQPVDIRTNAASDVTFLSAVQQCTFGGKLSNLFVTTSLVTTIMVYAIGGSGAAITASLPLP